MFQFGFTAINPGASPAAFSHRTGSRHADTPPPAWHSRAHPCCPLAEHRGRCQPILLPQVTPGWLWEQPDLSSGKVCFPFWEGIFRDYTSFREAKFVLNNKVMTLTYIHLAQLFIATHAVMHLCIAKINCVKLIFAITPWPAPETNLTHNI